MKSRLFRPCLRPLAALCALGCPVSSCAKCSLLSGGLPCELLCVYIFQKIRVCVRCVGRVGMRTALTRLDARLVHRPEFGLRFHALGVKNHIILSHLSVRFTSF